jgi:type I restriction enzyme, R subunit
MAYNEDTLVQQTTTDYLKDNLKWDESIYAFDEKIGVDGTLGRESEKEVVLKQYLLRSLQKLNPGLPKEAYLDAARQVIAVSASQSMLVTNKEKDSLYKKGVDVVFRDNKGERKKQRLRVFDFHVPENNHFMVVREFWIRGDIYRRRADIMGFVNGIPLIFMEVKNLHKDVKTAYEENFSDYKDTVPHLFHHNALVILGNGVDAKIGSITSKYEFFHEWKRLAEYEPGVVDMETLLKGICNKSNFMDIFENFIVFDESKGSAVKIVARNHQYLGVNKAVEAVRDRKNRDGKLGVFWHTQGSGKSYSIVFFSNKVHRKLGGNFTFLVLTDREDLDTQIYKTFAGCGLADNDADPCRAGSGQHLRTLLGQQKAYIFSLIQKFNQQVDENTVYSNRDDLIIITDEAHRTQYGTLALNMRNVLPNANFIGFTGTPLFKDDEITYRFFGDYISTYDFQRAVEDNATVPLFYDARGDKLKVATNDINEKIAEKLAEFELDDINVEQRLERELKREYHLFTDGPRLIQIAEDFVEHYSNGWESGKAMLICIDKITCVRMHKLIDFYWNQKIVEVGNSIESATDEQEQMFLQRRLEWMQETQTAVVISEEQGEVDKFKKWDLDIQPHRKLIKEGFALDDGKRIDLESAFKKGEHPFRVAIVCAMWLTGFDVPSLSTLYLDKPLKAHTLMQAIARANRVAEGKNNGLIVDYCGILKNLRSALSTFSGQRDEGGGGEGGDKDPAKPNEELIKELNQTIGFVKSFLSKNDFELEQITKSSGFSRNKAIVDAKEIINENDRSRKEFEIMAREVFKKFKACINIRPEVNYYRDERDAINIIYKSLQKDKEQADISWIIQELHKVIDESIVIDNPTDDFGEKEVADQSAPYDISKINFDILRIEFEKSAKKKTTVQNLRQAIENKLKRLLELNPLNTDFQAHYNNIVKEYNNEKDRVTIEKTFEALMVFVQDLSEEERRAIKEDLSVETLVLFDMLKKQDLSKQEIKKIKSVATQLLDTLKQEKLKIENWCEKETTRDAVRQTIYDFLFDEKTGLPTDQYEVDDIESITDEIYSHVYRVYPKLPSPVYEDVA